MTQIFSFACPRYVLNVSDRLVSTRLRSGLLHPTDARFNKNVVFAGRDGVVSLGFSGLARIDGVPTDQWIAAVLAGEHPTAPQGGPGRGIRISASNQPFPAGWPDVGRATEELRTKLEAASSRLSRADRAIGLAIDAVGWQWKWAHRPGEFVPRLLRPIAIGIEKQPSASTVQLYRVPRWWGWERNRWAVSANPRRPVLVAELNRTLAERSNLEAHVVEDVLVDGLRGLAADPAAGVGADYLSVRINPYHRRLIHIRYLPSAPEESSPLFTGWVVTPGIVHPPQVATGGSVSVHAGWVTIEYEGPTNEGPTFALSEQRRG